MTMPSPTSEKPPPVPKKDAKFIPLSKYATKNTVTKIENAGIIPTRPTRANTDDLTARASPAVRVAKERSATLPSASQSSLRGMEKAVPPRTDSRMNPKVVSNPATAEVAVARTISLSRKQSSRVHVPGPRLVAARRAAAAAAATEPEMPAVGSEHKDPKKEHSRTPSKTETSWLGHRHRRSASKSRSKDQVKIAKQPTDKTKMKEAERQMIKEARKWEILEQKAYSPVVVQAAHGHRPGLSVGLVVESV
jgi:hypothetical protein